MIGRVARAALSCKAAGTRVQLGLQEGILVKWDETLPDRKFWTEYEYLEFEREQRAERRVAFYARVRALWLRAHRAPALAASQLPYSQEGAQFALATALRAHALKVWRRAIAS